MAPRRIMSEVISPRLSQLKSSFDYEKQADKAVSQMDPLNIDDFLLGELPIINRKKTNSSLRNAINHAIDKSRALGRPDILEARAVIRDLGFMLASYAANGGDLVDVPTAVEAMNTAATITQEVPRDTVYSYGLRNPQDERMRTFTDVPQERIFIKSFTQAMTTLPQSIEALQSARDFFDNPDEVVVALNEGCRQFAGMTTSIIEVQQMVPPSVFTYELRPYFPPMNIKNETYFAPGGAQMPVLLMDTVLWASKGEGILDPEFKGYFDDNVRYFPASMRAVSVILSEQDSLVDKFIKVKCNPEYAKVGEAIARFAAEVGKFRYPHLKVAQDNMEIRPEGAVGSGGYDLQVLDMLIKNMKVTRKQTRRN